MKYIGYCRKSTDESDRQILSIESQIAELKEFADRQNVEILDFVTESRTAKMPGRPLFANVLKRIEKGEAQGIISWHPDRLARNSIDGGKIIYLLDTGKLIDLNFTHFGLRIHLRENLYSILLLARVNIMWTISVRM